MLQECVKDCQQKTEKENGEQKKLREPVQAWFIVAWWDAARRDNYTVKATSFDWGLFECSTEHIIKTHWKTV